LIVCRNPLLAEERARKRAELLAATERRLDAIVVATRRAQKPLSGQVKIGLRVGRVLNRHKVGKHFELTISDNSFSYHRNETRVEAEAALDGIYVIRTSMKPEAFTSEDAVRACKDLSSVEHPFRCLKTVDLKTRPIFHSLDDRVRAHVFLCMLAYYVEWHMRERLAPILFDDHERDEAEVTRVSIVQSAPRSEAARAKDKSNRTEDGFPVHSFRTLVDDLGTLAKNRVRIRGESGPEFHELTHATTVQQRALDLLDVTPSPESSGLRPRKRQSCQNITIQEGHKCGLGTSWSTCVRASPSRQAVGRLPPRGGSRPTPELHGIAEPSQRGSS